MPSLLALTVLGLGVFSAPPSEDEFAGFAGPDPMDEPMPVPGPRDREKEKEKEKGEEDSEARPRSWVVGGFIDAAYLLSSNFPGNHLYPGALTHPRTGEITLNVAAAYVQHQATEREPWRFELGMHAGAAVDALYAGEPVPGDSAGAYAGPEVWKHIALANAGYRFAVGTEVDVGLMASPIGFDAFWSKDNWTYSPALASNGVPYYLMGGRVTQPLGAGLSLTAWVVNGWQTIADVNQVPSGLVGLSWSRGETTLNGQVYFGPEQADSTADQWMVHGDTQVIWDSHPVGVAAVFDIGREGWAEGSSGQQWLGGGVWVRGDLWSNDRVSVVLAGRPEAWWDRDGRIYGIPQVLVSGTVGPSVTMRDLLQVRLEYRYDRSLASDGFFYRGDALALAVDQHTVLLNLLARFEHAFAHRPPS